MSILAKDIPGFEGRYTIFSDGSVYSCPRRDAFGRATGGNFLTPKKLPGHRKHLAVALYKNRTATYRQIHRLVADAFIPNPEMKKTVNHINGKQDDNRVENLEWATYQENQDHAWGTGLCKATVPKLSKEKDIPVVWEMRKSGASYQEIAKEFCVDPKCIWQIINGKSYKRC